MRRQHTTRKQAPQEQLGPAEVLPIYRPGDKLIFKYEGNLRATIIGAEMIGGMLWVETSTTSTFTVPACRIVGVERAEKGDAT